MTDAKHEAPAETITSAELIANTDYARGAVRVPGETEDRRIYGQPEAPAEGAGEQWLWRIPGRGWVLVSEEAEVVREARVGGEWVETEVIALSSLRARSSAPEAREGEAVAMIVRKGFSTGSLRYTERGQHADLQDGTKLYTHPAAPSGDHAELTRLAEAAGEEALGNLLAVIHGDGGHRALEVGVEQAAAEAEKIVARLLSSAPEAREPVAWRYPTVGGGWSYFGAELPRAREKGEPVYTHPAAPSADKLREVLVDMTSWFTKPVQGQSGMVWVIPAGERGADDALNAALAALKAEGAK